MPPNPSNSIPSLVWPAAFLLGVIIAAGSLSYAPEGRVNILWVWMIWALMPFAGSIISFLVTLFGSARPWLFQWRNNSFGWFPSTTQRYRMLLFVQYFWCTSVFGMFCSYWLALVFTDVAFGWSSTLITDSEFMSRAVDWVAWPWRSYWPEAVPGPEVIAGTRYLRIDPGATDAVLSGEWWRFLMAGLIFYNFLPRLLLAGFTYLKWRKAAADSDIQVRRAYGSAPELDSTVAGDAQPSQLEQQQQPDWNEADGQQASWEFPEMEAPYQFGLSDWAVDEARMQELIENTPDRRQILWLVDSTGTPVAELGDLIAMAKDAGFQRQGVLARMRENTEPERHLASWQSFARRHGLVWVSPVEPETSPGREAQGAGGRR